MKKFLLQTVVFLVIVIGLIIATILITDQLVKSKADFTLKGAPTNIAFGHSHAAYAFNDTLISSFANVAATGESNFYTYLKAKEILEANKQIKNVFIAFTNNQIIKATDQTIWGDMYLSNR